MRYAPFNCAKFSLFSALSQSGNRLLFVKWLLSKPKVGLLVVPKTCAYMWGIAV